MITPNGSVFGLNPKFNNVTVGGITTVTNATDSTTTNRPNHAHDQTNI